MFLQHGKSDSCKNTREYRLDQHFKQACSILAMITQQGLFHFNESIEIDCELYSPSVDKFKAPDMMFASFKGRHELTRSRAVLALPWTSDTLCIALFLTLELSPRGPTELRDWAACRVHRRHLRQISCHLETIKSVHSRHLFLSNHKKAGFMNRTCKRESVMNA